MANQTLPLDDHPDPVLEYTVVDGNARATTTNETFDSVFGGQPVDSPVSVLFDRFTTVEATGPENPEVHLVRGDSIGIYLDGFDQTEPYFARVVPTGDATGYLLFTPLDDCPAITEGADVGQVATAISHDLRNPLDVAKAHLRAARETGETEHFEAVSRAHDRMGRIIRDVLTLAREGEAVDPSDRISIETAASEAWQTVDTDDAALSVSDSLPTTTADADRVKRLFENLFRNAVEHSDGSVTISVDTLEDGFFVADDGPGVPEDERSVVFDPGYTTTDGGTGLGLAIVDRIVDAHGWDLTLTESRDGGARFEIVL